MSEQNHGKREAGRPKGAIGRQWARYKEWLAGMTRGQKIRYRLLQTATILAVLIIIGSVALGAWIQMPEIPNPSGSQSEDLTGDLSGDLSNPGDASFAGTADPKIAESGRKDGVYTFLVAGRDVASGGTDTMLLLTYDTNAKTIHGLNLPRDTMMNVGTVSKRLNAIYGNNRGKEGDEKAKVARGMNALKAAVDDITGITPDYYVLVRWEAIGELVDAIDGVDFEIPFNMNYDDPYQNLHIHQKKGMKYLDGDDAMQVVRWRKNNDGSNSGGGDIARLSIQQDFLKAVAKKCLQPATFLKLPELARVFTQNVETDLTVGNILALAQKAVGMNPETGVTFQTAPIGAMFMYKGSSLVTLDADEMLEIINKDMNPYLRDVKKSDLELVVKVSGGFTVTSGKLNSSIQKGSGSSSSSGSGKTSTGSSGTSSKPASGGSTGQNPSTEKPGTTQAPGTGGDTSQGSGTGSGGDTSQGSGTGSGGDTSQGSGTGSSGGDTSQGSGTGSGGGDTSQGSGTGSGGDTSQGSGTGSGGGDTSQGSGTPSGGSGEGSGGSGEGSGGSGETPDDPGEGAGGSGDAPM